MIRNSSYDKLLFENCLEKSLENFAYKSNLNWWIFALAGLLALGIALLTVSWQSWRAATRNPVDPDMYLD